MVLFVLAARNRSRYDFGSSKIIAIARHGRRTKFPNSSVMDCAALSFVNQ